MNKILALVKRFNVSFSTWIIIGMVLGIACGLMFGNACQRLSIVGDIYVTLLLMCVMPYIVTTLMLGIGRLSINEAKLIALKGGFITLLFWSIAIFFVLLMPVTFPEWESAGFYSADLIRVQPEINSLGLYISSNPFNALAESVVPAVVLFCICVGVALITIPNKAKLLEDMEIFSIALEKVTTAMVKLAPFGTFAITAVAAGTMTLAEIARLQVYFISFIAAALLMTFVIFPLIITTFTPYSYRSIFKVSKEVLLIAFTTSNLFILLPLIARDIRILMRQYDCYTKERDSLNDIIIPICYIFPCTGKLLTILFVTFAAWFDGVKIEVYRYPEFIITSLLSFMGSANFAIPFLLNHFHISSKLFDVYLMAGIINGKFATLLAAIYLLGFTLVCNAWMTGMLKIDLKKIISSSVIIVVSTAATLALTAFVLSFTPKTNTEIRDILANMRLKNPVKMVVVKDYPKPSLLDKVFTPAPGSNRLEAIKQRGVLRVGYNPNARPFTYFNRKGNLVGFDVAMANMLARDLGCTLKFIPIRYSNIGKGLNANIIDIAMAGISKTVKRIDKLDFTNDYIVVTMALITKDYRANEFRESAVVARKKFTVALLKGSAYLDIVPQMVPRAKVVMVDKIADFFTEKVKADALLTSAEQGTAYCMLYPKYQTVVPKPDIIKDSFAYVIAKHDLEFSKYINEWLDIKRNNHSIKKLYNYWIMGKNIDYKKPRWSIWNNVLHMNREAEELPTKESGKVNKNTTITVKPPNKLVSQKKLPTIKQPTTQ